MKCGHCNGRGFMFDYVEQGSAVVPMPGEPCERCKGSGEESRLTMNNSVFDQLQKIDPDAHAALESIAAECIGQRQREGWTVEHDDSHARGEMARAAACYVNLGGWMIRAEERSRSLATTAPSMATPRDWPWAPEWWKPKSAMSNLTRGAALIVAEMGRQLRLYPSVACPTNARDTENT